MNTPGYYAAMLAIAATLATAEGRPAAAADSRSTAADQKSVSITIYNDNLGLVKDVRAITLTSGTQNLWFEGVAAQIDPTTVHIVSLDAPGALSVLEQNFEYDLVSPSRLMEKYLGQTVELLMEHEDGSRETVRAKLIGNQEGAVYELEDGRIAVNPEAHVVLPSLPAGLISKPSLVWLLDSKRPRQTVEASYLTGGIGWKADYVVVLASDEKKVGLSGWVTINNQSGATYENAALKLVAGDVNRVQPEVAKYPVAVMEGRMSREEGFTEESFFEYHLYTLERKTTIKDNQTKQIALLSAENVSVKKSFVVEPRAAYWFARNEAVEKPKVGVFLSLDNTKKNGMGMPLPKGVVRVYKKDSRDALQFIGEDRIDHTPEDEAVRVKMGDAFDVVVERKQMSFEVLASGHLYRSSYQVDLRNHKDEAIVVSVVENLYGDWTVTQSSHKHEKESASRARFDVPVPAKGSAQLTYTVEFKH
jgi:hypothetical protein